MELVIRTGSQDERSRIRVSWFDHNNVRQMTVVDINILPQDKPRTLEIKANGVIIATVPPSN